MKKINYLKALSLLIIGILVLAGATLIDYFLTLIFR